MVELSGTESTNGMSQLPMAFLYPWLLWHMCMRLMNKCCCVHLLETTLTSFCKICSSAHVLCKITNPYTFKHLLLPFFDVWIIEYYVRIQSRVFSYLEHVLSIKLKSLSNMVEAMSTKISSIEDSGKYKTANKNWSWIIHESIKMCECVLYNTVTPYTYH